MIRTTHFSFNALLAHIASTLMLAVGTVHAQPFAYVTGGTGNLAIINTATNTVVANVVTGADPIGVAVNPAGTRVYALNYTSGSVSVINTANAGVVATIPVGANPVGVAFNAAGTRAYVANRDGTASVIDTAINSVIAA